MSWMCTCGYGELSTFAGTALPPDECPLCGFDLSELRERALLDQEDEEEEEEEEAD